MKKNISDCSTFCALPWIHLSTRPNGHMRVCCTANASSVGATNDKIHGGEVGILKNDDGKPANFNHTSLSEAWNNSYMRNIRKDMLNDRIPPSCVKCFKEESSGHRSKRQWETEFWNNRIDIQGLVNETKEDGSIPQKVYYIDLRLGTKCNLKCAMCSPHDSSLWVDDWNKLHPQIENETLKESMQWDNKGQVDGATYNWHINNEKFWDELYLQIPHIKQLYFAGGEATIIEHHYLLLEKCIEMGHANKIQLRYNSNGVELPDRLFRLWKEFKSVRFHYSIDSIEKMNDYIRHPSKWSHMKEMFHKLDNTEENVEVTIACAVQMFNMYYLPDFIKWKWEMNFKKINIWPLGAGMINYHFVYHPPHLNVKVFPASFKMKIRAKYEEFYQWLEETIAVSGGDSYTKEEFLRAPYGIKRLKGMVDFMDSEDWSRRLPEFREYVQLLDKIRGTSFEEVFPEMAEIMREDYV
jgi:MoaA/NifB/PqqE/SkfB family radical SAM enzyme